MGLLTFTTAMLLLFAAASPAFAHPQFDGTSDCTQAASSIDLSSTTVTTIAMWLDRGVLTRRRQAAPRATWLGDWSVRASTALGIV